MTDGYKESDISNLPCSLSFVGPSRRLSKVNPAEASACFPAHWVRRLSVDSFRWISIFHLPVPHSKMQSYLSCSTVASSESRPCGSMALSVTREYRWLPPLLRFLFSNVWWRWCTCEVICKWWIRGSVSSSGGSIKEYSRWCGMVILLREVIKLAQEFAQI